VSNSIIVVALFSFGSRIVLVRPPPFSLGPADCRWAFSKRFLLVTPAGQTGMHEGFPVRLVVIWHLNISLSTAHPVSAA
jgi:hypothetical protein